MAVTFSNRSLAQQEKIALSSNEASPVPVERIHQNDPVKAYNALIDGARMENKNSIDMRKLDKRKLREFYNQMTEEQRKTAPFAFLLSLTLPEKKSPTQEQFKEWMEPQMFGVWLDDQRISNEKLKDYQPEDIVLYYQSRLEKNAKNYGKHTYQLNAYTLQGYENLIQRLKDAD